MPRTTFESASDLERALERAQEAHRGHETRIGASDPNWRAWYADYIVRERAGEAAAKATPMRGAGWRLVGPRTTHTGRPRLRAASTLRSIENVAHELQEVEREGESGATFLILVASVFLFLIPVFALMLGCAFAAYYLA